MAPHTQVIKDIRRFLTLHDTGTLLLSMAGRKSGKIAWQGFASLLIENDAFIKDEGTIREAVNLIFEDTIKGQRSTRVNDAAT